MDILIGRRGGSLIGSLSSVGWWGIALARLPCCHFSALNGFTILRHSCDSPPLLLLFLRFYRFLRIWLTVLAALARLLLFTVLLIGPISGPVCFNIFTILRAYRFRHSTNLSFYCMLFRHFAARANYRACWC